DGIRDRNVTGVQTCALPILSPGRGYGDEGGALRHVNARADATVPARSAGSPSRRARSAAARPEGPRRARADPGGAARTARSRPRSEERRVGKEGKPRTGAAR